MMSETLFLRELAGLNCGPKARRALETDQGIFANSTALDATGETWNRTHSSSGLIYPAGVWQANLYLKKVLFNATVNVVIARYSASCVEQEQMLNVNQEVTAIGFTLHTFPPTVSLRVIFQPGDLLLCIVSEVSGDAEIEFNQSGGSFSHLLLPDKTTVRPVEYYKRQRRRRSN